MRLAGSTRSDQSGPHPHIKMPKARPSPERQAGFRQKPSIVRFLFNNDPSGCQVGRRGIMYRWGIPEGFLEEVTWMSLGRGELSWPKKVGKKGGEFRKGDRSRQRPRKEGRGVLEGRAMGIKT